MAEENVIIPEGGTGAGTPPTDNTPPTDGQGQTPPATPPSAEEMKSFTQAQLDEMIQKAKGQVAKKFGDYDDLKKKLEEHEAAAKQKELDEMTELDRLKAQLAEKEESFSKLAKEAALNKIHSAFEKAAKLAEIPEKYLEDAKLLAGVNEGTALENIGEIVKGLVESKPFLVEKKPVEQPNIGGANNPPQNNKADKSNEQMLQEAADKARKSGRLEDKVAYVALKRTLGM